MRPLPEQAVHRPFESGPYRMAMDLVSVPDSEWFEFDRRYLPEMAEKRRLLATARAEVFAAAPGSDDARREALDLIAANLTKHHPDWFSRDGTSLWNRLTGEYSSVHPLSPSTTDRAPPSFPDASNREFRQSEEGVICRAAGHASASAQSPETVEIGERAPSGPCTQEVDPLVRAACLVQEDLCLVQNTERGPVLSAAVLCFPSRWRLLDKIGKPLSAVHGPVPLYQDRLARPVDRFMRHLKPGHIVFRQNWSLLDDPALFQPSGKWRTDGGSDITPHNAGSRVFLRVERQTLRRLPISGAVLFGIRVHVYSVERVIDRPDRAATLADAVRALPPEVQHYKSLLPFQAALLGWLDGRSR
jgi:hypothetical protein